ncbi:MAG TPA: EAL domain-containing protein, partial [Solirubrobacterales bacterium]|nr:EAL domain-containing protein [Solirubrobacterales bacterium]
YDITERKAAEEEAERRAAQQAAVAELGERALEGAEPDDLMRAAVELVTQVEDVEYGCVWEMPVKGRALQLRAGLDGPDELEGRRASATRDSHAGAALDSGLHVIVDDWQHETRFTMPPALRILGVRSSLAVVIDGHKSPFGVIDVHSTVANRFAPGDVHFVVSVANVLADAIERRMADEALRYRVLHDGLTGLPNKLLFGDTLNGALKRCAAAGAPVGVLFLDIDHFKLINDSLGHHAGDELLRSVAPRLRSRLRPGDTVARFGGDEFGVLVENLSDEQEALTIAERISTAFARPFALEGVDHFVTASVGIAVARPQTETTVDADELIRDADAAMYRAKEKGRARIEIFDAEMRARAVRRLEMERELRHVIEREELVLQYQPIVSLGSGSVTGVEALVRWRHPERGLLQPSEFIGVAEDSGLIEPIGRWVMEEACTQALAWMELRPDERPLDVSVNLSARQVAHRDLPSTVAEILARTGLEPGQLRLEITESVLVEEANATATLEALKELGVSLILDDFGTGYSSLAYLNRFPLDALKIDRSFIEPLGVRQERSAIVEAIVSMAGALSLDVIAEGVETELQLSEVRSLGCPFAQGFFFARPLSSQQVTNLLTESTRPFADLVATP